MEMHGVKKFSNFGISLSKMAKRWEDYKPAVDRTILVLMAFILWILVGVMLSRSAIIWWESYMGSLIPLFVVLGLFLGLFKGYFILTRVVNINIKRIYEMEGTGFILSFISLRTYLLIIGMMILGMLLRHSSFPKHYLAIIYLGVGLAMIISSYPYLKILLSGSLKKSAIQK
jgi:hypothetical protein